MSRCASISVFIHLLSIVICVVCTHVLLHIWYDVLVLSSTVFLWEIFLYLDFTWFIISRTSLTVLASRISLFFWISSLALDVLLGFRSSEMLCCLCLSRRVSWCSEWRILELASEDLRQTLVLPSRAFT